jgi:hypothetical protein
MKEDLYELYKMNENYHDQKENKIWVSFGLYYSYSITSIITMLQSKIISSIGNVIFLFIFDIAILILASIFIYQQTKLKYNSVLKTTALAKKIVEEYSEDNKNYLKNKIWNDVIDLESKDKFMISFNEIILFFIALVLFFCKYIFIISFENICNFRFCEKSIIFIIMVVFISFLLGIIIGLNIAFVRRKSKLILNI